MEVATKFGLEDHEVFRKRVIPVLNFIEWSEFRVVEMVVYLEWLQWLDGGTSN